MSLLLLFVALTAVKHEKIDFIDEYKDTDDETDQNGTHFEVYWREYLCCFCGGGGTHHGAVVHGDKETDKLGEMANICTVVVVSFAVWQIDQVVQKECDGKSYDDES